MDKEAFIKLCVITFAAWRFHPGYKYRDVEPPTMQECIDAAEELWASFHP